MRCDYCIEKEMLEDLISEYENEKDVYNRIMVASEGLHLTHLNLNHSCLCKENPNGE